MSPATTDAASDAAQYAEILLAAALLAAVIGLVAAASGCVWLVARLCRARAEVGDLKRGNTRLTGQLLEAQQTVVRQVRREEPHRWARTEMGMFPLEAPPSRTPRGPAPASSIHLASTLPSVEAMRSSGGWGSAEDLDRTGKHREGPGYAERIRLEQEALLPPSSRAPVEGEPPPLPSKPPPSPSTPPSRRSSSPPAEPRDVHSRETTAFRATPPPRGKPTK